ncbi:hypothetical protein [Faecalibacillus intestinalis]|uniref:hypothetical protein n=1 Tax=Faecalibacillus intestinalis TaxID=1982626 RepID=UPI003521EA52
MNKNILVYDNLKNNFRELNEANYNNDHIIGTIFFKRNAIEILKKNFIICGYILIGNDGTMFPIDIKNTDIAILESTYNHMSTEIKFELISYNITEKPSIIWSNFFFQWQFKYNLNIFNENGSFIEMISKIINNKKILKLVIQNNYHFLMPSNYKELSEFVINLSKLFSIDFYNPKYIDEANYIIDSLINEYHLNMTEEEIELYCFQISAIINNNWRNLV